jgi:hypothetical protein
MITHDFLIENGFRFIKYEDSLDNSSNGRYEKFYNDNDNNLIIIVLDKFSDKEDDFTDIIMFVSYKNQEVKIRRHLSPLSKDMFNEVIKLVTT